MLLNHLQRPCVLCPVKFHALKAYKIETPFGRNSWMFWGAVCRSGQTVSQQLRWRLWATSHISVSTEHKKCCVHLLALPCIYVVIHHHYSITGISNLLFYSSRTKKRTAAELEIFTWTPVCRCSLTTRCSDMHCRQLEIACRTDNWWLLWMNFHDFCSTDILVKQTCLTGPTFHAAPASQYATLSVFI